MWAESLPELKKARPGNQQPEDFAAEEQQRCTD